MSVQSLDLYLYPADEDLEYWRDCESDGSSEACSEDECQMEVLPTFVFLRSSGRKALALSVWLMGFLLTLQARFYLPDKSVDLLIKFLSTFLTIILAKFSSPLKDLSKDFPCSRYENELKVYCGRIWKEFQQSSFFISFFITHSPLLILTGFNRINIHNCLLVLFTTWPKPILETIGEWALERCQNDCLYANCWKYRSDCTRCPFVCCLCVLLVTYPQDVRLVGFLDTMQILFKMPDRWYCLTPLTPLRMEAAKQRSNKDHRDSIKKIKDCKTKTEKSKVCMAPLLYLICCSTWFALLRCPSYVDAPRMLSIDPMHNLFLGTYV